MRKLVPMLLCLLGMSVLASAAAAAKADFTLGVNPASQSVQQGQSAAYTVTAAATGGFSGSIALTAAGQPGTASFAPPSITTSGTSSLTLTTSSTTPTGTYPVMITAASGRLSHSISVTLTVNRALSPSLALSATPASATVPTGSTAAYTIGINRTNFTGAVSLSVYGGLPSGAAATLNPSSTTGNSSTLQVSTSATTPPGSYTVYVVGSSSGGNAYAQVELDVAAPSGKPFTVSGNPAGTLAPGAPALPVDLLLQNPNNQDLAISTLTVTVAKTSSAGCAAGNFAVTQYSGPYPLRLAARQTATLSQLGVPASALPRIVMLDLPTSQDACKNATVALAYSGAGQGA